MDELLFHISQRLDSLQVLAYTAIQNGRILVETYTEQGYQLAISAYNSPQVAHFQDVTSEKVRQLLAAVKKFGTATFQHWNPAVVYAWIATIIGGPDLNRSNLCAGFIGFALGGSVGIVVGLCLKSPSQPVAYMRAIAATSFTGIDTVALLEDAIAPLVSSPDDVLIEVRAASIDPIDIKISGGYSRTLRRHLNKYNPNVRGELPVVLGRDCAGIVIDLGSLVTRLEIGDEVWAVVPPWSPGVASEVVSVKQCFVARKPRCLGFEGAASLPYAGSVAWDAVVNRAKLTSVTARNKKVLVHCGSSGAGVLITQLCRIWGANVTVTCLNRVSQTMTTLGADEVVPLETADIEKQLLRERFDVVFNTAGPVAHQFCLDLCVPDGVVVTPVCSTIASDTYGMFLGTLYSAWIRLAHSIFGYSSWGIVPLNVTVLNELSKLVDSGLLQPVVDKIFAPHDYERAFQHIDSARSIGKSVVKFSGSSKSLAHGRPDVIT